MEVHLETQDTSFWGRFNQAAEAVRERGRLAFEKSGQKAGRETRARAYFKAVSEMLNLYASPENFKNALPPQYSFPRDLAQNLSGLSEFLATGKIPDPIKHCARKGNIVGPSEKRDIRCAVVYIVAAKRGLISDRTPVKTVTDLYGCGDRRAVQGWMQGSKSPVTADELAVGPDLIEARMTSAASRYAKSGRSRKAIAEREGKRRRAK
jgi:hypothetical protein